MKQTHATIRPTIPSTGTAASAPSSTPMGRSTLGRMLGWEILATLCACLAVLPPTRSAELPFLDRGHTDIALDYSPDTGTWDVHVGSDATGEEFPADKVLLRVNGIARTTIPSGAKFAFLGTAGDPMWLLPQTENEGLLFLGYGGDGIPDDVFVDNQVKVLLKSVEGPGDLLSYRVDGFGTPQILFNTRDGITDRDTATVQSGGDAHVNWAFSQPGEYRMTLEAVGIRRDTGTSASSGPVAFAFSVLKPVVFLTNEHVDLRVLYNPAGTNNLAIVARDEDHQMNYQTNECVLVANQPARLTLPEGTPFGDEGAPLNILPQSQDPSLLYLGISAEGVPSGVFTGGLTFHLKDVQGPGSFFLWQASAFGDYNVKMNSANGLSDADSTSPIIGSHEHYNWGFTRPGIYYVTLQVSGRRTGENTDIASLDTPFVFHVLPLPPSPATLRIVGRAINGDLQVEISGDPSATYELQTSQDLTASWATQQTVTLQASKATLTVPFAGPAVFVRALAPTP